MQVRQLGSSGPKVSAIALGCMGMSGMYGPADRAESIATIHAALDAGVTLIDTGDFYGMGHNEMLIAEALKGVPRDRYQLSVKFGALRDPSGAWVGFDARPAAVKTFLAHSLQRLGVGHIDIYRPARLDPGVPIEDTVGAIAEMVKAGYVGHAGLSEVGSDTIRRASAASPICDLQIEYSLISRGVEDSILPALRQAGVAVTAYGVLSRGLISGRWSKDALGPADWRAHSPRFQGGNVDRNLALVEALRPRRGARAWRESPSPGSWPRARTSSRSSARGAAPSSTRRSAPSTSSSAPTTLPRSNGRRQRGRRRASATILKAWRPWIASGDERGGTSSL